MLRAVNRSLSLVCAVAFSAQVTAAQGIAAQGAAVRGTRLIRRPDGIALAGPNGTLTVQLWSDQIARVVFRPAGAPAPGKSLAVVAIPRRVRFTLGRRGDRYVLRTAKMTAEVEADTGLVRFLGPDGTPFLTEAGREVRPATVAGRSTWQATERFFLWPQEGIYGLGQHQQGAMNYLGSRVHLEQRNTEVAVPVMMSTRGYGLFWNNPAITDVTVGRPPGAIPVGQLFTPEGMPGGLTAEYFQGENFERLVGARQESDVDYDWTANPPFDLPHDHYSVRWSGQFESGEAGDYQFQTRADDGVRLWVDGKLLIDDWSVHPADDRTAHIHLEAHRRYAIKLEFFQATRDSVVQLRCGQPQPKGRPLMEWTSEAGNGIDYYVLYGPRMSQAIAEYRTLTGKVPMLGRWAWGFWQCKEHYASQKELEDVVDRYRAARIPLDGIIQDWFYWDPAPWGSHKLDPKRYPNPKAMLARFHRQGVHALISVWAKFADGSANYRELKNAGELYPKTGDASYYDAFNPAARATYWRQMRDELFSLGFDGWWLDASEPELSGKWGEFRNVPTAAGPGALVYNAYPLEHTTSVYQGQRATTAKKRVFILTRSAYAGQQRNAAVTWSGDIAGSWDVFAKQIPAGINFSLSGIPYWNTDIGGFFGGDPKDPAYRELFVRWFQFGAFCPMFRVHGTNRPKEMWRFGPDVEKILVRYDRLRYRLLPYLYSVSWQVSRHDDTMMRGLPLDFQWDLRARDVADQYLFGPALMVNPVVRPGIASRSVYLPEGTTWIDFWTGKPYPGGQTVEAATPLDRLPLFVRAGSIVPMGPVVRYAAEKPADPIELRIYPGADGSFTLYEDQGDGYAYEKGVFATIPMKWDDRSRTLTLGRRYGGFPEMLTQRTFRIVLVRPSHGAGPETEKRADVTVSYSGKLEKVRIPGG